MPNLILVTGATGNAGRSAVRSLLAKGYAVRAATRNINRIPSDAGVEAVPFDFSIPNTLVHALEGVTGLFLVAPPMDPDVHNKLAPFIELARDTGLPHLVLLSALGVDKNEEAPLRGLEQTVIDSGIPWTILRPNFFMENFSAGFLAPMIKDQGSIVLAAGDGKTSFVSAEDIARVATVSFDEGGTGREYSLTGPEALDHGEVAAMISEAIGSTVTYQAISEEMMLQGARDQGLPESSVQYLGFLYTAVRSGYCATIYDDVRKVTGKEPMSFRSFVQEKREAWL
jgi:uncharacterized protein YbjT (DUF2867 family)